MLSQSSQHSFMQRRGARDETQTAQTPRTASVTLQQRHARREAASERLRHCSMMLNSVRRFSALPAAVAFEAIGLVSPYPTASRRLGSTPSLISADITVFARFCESFRLNAS